jgi:hypothetical protein
MLRFTKLVVVGVLAGTLGLVGCSEDAGGTGGTGGTVAPTCESTACILCPAEALGPNGAVFGDLNVPLVFTAVPQGPVVQGGTVTIEVAGSTQISDLPVPVEATVVGGAGGAGGAGSTTTYIATTGGDGTLEIPIPQQMIMGTDLKINAGSGSGPFDVDDDATELVIGLNSAVINIKVTSPAPLDLRLDASDTGDCSVVGNGVSIPVSGGGGAGGAGGGG